MFTRTSKIFFLIFFCAQLRIVTAQSPTINLSPETAHYTIGSQTTYFEDKTAKRTFEQILSADVSKQFVQTNKPSLNFGVTASAIWVQFKVQNKNPSVHLSKWLLTLASPHFDSLTLYQQDKMGHWVAEETGDMQLFSQRKVQHYNFVFALNIPDTMQRTYYIRFETSSSMQIQLNLQSELFFIKDSSLGSIGHGIFYGALFIMLFYNLFLFFSLKDKSYLAYVFFIFINILLQASFSGHLTQYILGEYPYWARLSIPLLMSATPIGMGIFTILFLDTKRFVPKIHTFLIVLIGLSSLNLLLSFFVNRIVATPIAGMLIMLISVVIFIAGVQGWRKGYKAARFFMTAWSVLILAALVTSLRNFGLIPSTLLTRMDVKIALLLEVVFLSLALADKYNWFRRDKEAAQLEILRLHENANKELEAQVILRTAELNQSLDDLKLAQMQLIQSEKMASLGELTAGIAHEINNPINFVASSLQPLKRNLESLKSLIDQYDDYAEQPSPDKLQEIVDYKEEIDYDYTKDEIEMLLGSIQDGATRTTEIVKSLRNFSRLDEADRKKACLNEGLESTLLILQSNLKQKKIRLVKSLGEIPEIQCYAGQLNQVFMNILNNAIQAMPNQGTLTVKTFLDTNGIKIAISDTGSGIPEAILSKIFDPFFTTKQVGEGTGLGLSISYGIVKKHNGTIEVESEVGKGSTFVIQLPIQ
jgi:signal transduction histidine kinase